MSVRSVAGRLLAMDGEEVRFRLAGASRTAAQRARFAIARPAWRRADLAAVLDPASGSGVRDAIAAASRGDHLLAHRVLARHLETRARRWPIAANRREALSAAIRAQFPTAAIDARDRADRIVSGRFDLLGYHDLPLGSPPDWHADVVNRRHAPRGFWASVPFLNPAIGDHKVIWEANRHQHFLALGEAFWLTERHAYRDTFVAHLEDWLQANPPLDGVNWASMLELALRAISWTSAVEFFCAGSGADEVPWLVDLFVALDRQLVHIGQNLSTYFSPNTHITGEALALYAVSLAFPELRQSAARAAIGRRILLRQAAAQISEDGGHAELSTHYHRYSTDFYLLALLAARHAGDPAAAAFERPVAALAAFLRTMADDRGRLPGFGDDDGGQLFRFAGACPQDASATLSALADALGNPSLAVAQSTPEAFWILGDRPAAAVSQPSTPWPSRLLASSGYFVSRSDRGHLVFDAGPHGFLNGGHAHADALSIVLSVRGEPVFVDPGTGTYTMDAGVRDRFRAPDMHNTLTVEGRRLATPDGPFRWRRSVDAVMVAAHTSGEGDAAIGGHVGYGFPLMRAVIYLPAIGWLIADYAASEPDVTLACSWHLHPAWSATLARGGFALTHTSGASLALATTAHDRSIEPGEISPAYGRLQPASVLRTRIQAPGPLAMAAFAPVDSRRGACPIITLVEKSLSHRDWISFTWALSHEGRELHVTVAFPADFAARPHACPWPRPCIDERRVSCVE